MAACGPSAVVKTSTVWAMHAMRETMGIASPSRPSGRPLPSQCSSRARTASATAGGKPIIATIRAPRSQRASLSWDASFDSVRRARSSVAARTIRGAPGATSRAANRTRSAVLVQSIFENSRFSGPSGVRNSSAMRAALVEQPASFRSVA